MGEEESERERERELHKRSWWVNPKGGDHLKTPDADGLIILKWISTSGMGGMHWIDLAHAILRTRLKKETDMNYISRFSSYLAVHALNAARILK
jgi:hypothetical protein